IKPSLASLVFSVLLFPSPLSLNNISLALASSSSSSSSRSASHHASTRFTVFLLTVTIDFSVGSREGKFAISLKFLKEWSHFLSFDYFVD
uniref:Uncharacterized protein n=2 Tax=Brassica oleracea TaxID=3712 RepID=A0A0D3DFV3_BRAOL